MFRLLLVICGLWVVFGADAQTAQDQRMLARATPYFGQLRTALEAWPGMPMRSFVAAQVEQESLWNPTAELCVPKPTCARERGVGFGQFTITPRFNAFEEVKRMHPALRDWSFSDRYNTQKQLLAIVVKDKFHFGQCKPLMSNDWGALACVASSYNGGFGGFTADRKLCSNTAGCDPRRWTGHIAETSFKAKKPLEGYGKSFYQINREYVVYLMSTRSPKYVPYLGS